MNTRKVRKPKLINPSERVKEGNTTKKAAGKKGENKHFVDYHASIISIILLILLRVVLVEKALEK